MPFLQSSNPSIDWKNKSINWPKVINSEIVPQKSWSNSSEIIFSNLKRSNTKQWRKKDVLQLLEVNSLLATDYKPEEGDEYFLTVIKEVKSNNDYSVKTKELNALQSYNIKELIKDSYLIAKNLSRKYNHLFSCRASDLFNSEL